MRLERLEHPPIRWSRELWRVGGALLVWTGGEYLRVRRKPRTPVERKAQRVLNRIDRIARRHFYQPTVALLADRIADGIVFAAMPLACTLTLLPYERPRRHFLADGLLIGRAATVTGAVNETIKFLTPRERPFAFADPRAEGWDRYGSFFSNHTSAAAAMAATTSFIAQARGASPWLAVPLFALASFVGYLRIAGDKHYFTDVIAGAAFGTATGAFFTRKLV